MDCHNILKKKLRRYKESDIIITDHAQIQAIRRNISLDEVKGNIYNPKRLVFAEKQTAKKEGEEKYDCYFGYSKTQCHRYILVVNNNCVVCTIIKINRRWQRIFEKHNRR